MNQHPNTIVGGGGGGAGVLLVFLLNKYAHTSLGPEESAAIATGTAAVLLFIGRKGLRGIVQAVWRGSH